jgi:predicted chitinase
MTDLIAALKTAAPGLDADHWGPALTAGFAKYGFNTNKRIAAAIGQFMQEAGPTFHEVEESLYYTHPERIRAVFPREFPTVASAVPYARNPEKLADRVYANRNGNGDEASGDGYLFRGRGLIQVTGRTEYTAFAQTIGQAPADAANYCVTDAGAAMSGCWYLESNGCLPLADAWEIDAITRKVNGSAMLGASQRRAYSSKMLAALSD